MKYEVEYTDKFEDWWITLNEYEQDKVEATVILLEEYGPNLPYPYSSGIKNSRISNLRELRIQYRGSPYRVLYCFDPRRKALLLLGGNKEGKKRWYQENIPLAEKLYKEHLEDLK